MTERYMKLVGMGTAQTSPREVAIAAGLIKPRGILRDGQSDSVAKRQRQLGEAARRAAAATTRPRSEANAKRSLDQLPPAQRPTLTGQQAARAAYQARDRQIRLNEQESRFLELRSA